MLGHVTLKFLRNCPTLFPTATPFFIPTRNVYVMISPHTWPQGCEVVSCGFGSHFPGDSMLSMFSCAYWLSVHLLWKNVYPSLLLIFLNWVIWFFYYCLCSLYIWGISSLSDIWFSSIFFLFVDCTSFSLLHTLKHKCFEFYLFVLCCLCFWCQI